MKFRIRFAEQIVGLFIIAAVLAIILVIVMIGGSQRWFARDYTYVAYFDTASGLSANMAIQYKGFTIGTIKSVRLAEDDRVEVVLAIQDTYNDRVVEGSLVDVSVSPIGLGNQFLFYPGRGTKPMEEDAEIPTVHSPTGRAYVRDGLVELPAQDDSITLLISRVSLMLDEVTTVLTGVDEALQGSDASVLGRTLGGVEETINSMKELPADVTGMLDSLLGDLRPILANLETLSDRLIEPEGLIDSALSPQGEIKGNLEASFRTLSDILTDVERTAAFLPTQIPQAAALMAELRKTLATAEDVLTALSNNPLLRNGIPDQAQTDSSGVNLRGITF